VSIRVDCTAGWRCSRIPGWELVEVLWYVQGGSEALSRSLAVLSVDFATSISLKADMCAKKVRYAKPWVA
jgi:hypothetical protein